MIFRRCPIRVNPKIFQELLGRDYSLFSPELEYWYTSCHEGPEDQLDMKYIEFKDEDIAGRRAII